MRGRLIVAESLVLMDWEGIGLGGIAGTRTLRLAELRTARAKFGNG